MILMHDACGHLHHYLYMQTSWRSWSSILFMMGKFVITSQAVITVGAKIFKIQKSEDIIKLGPLLCIAV